MYYTPTQCMVLNWFYNKHAVREGVKKLMKYCIQREEDVAKRGHFSLILSSFVASTTSRNAKDFSIWLTLTDTLNNWKGLRFFTQNVKYVCILMILSLPWMVFNFFSFNFHIKYSDFRIYFTLINNKLHQYSKSEQFVISC